MNFDSMLNINVYFEYTYISETSQKPENIIINILLVWTDVWVEMYLNNQSKKKKFPQQIESKIQNINYKIQKCM